jgi:DNA polymerase/3'-5' exonuclease PolX
MQQRLGIDCFSDLRQETLRSTIVYVETMIANILHECSKGIWVERVGPFRRGNASSNDIDVLILPPKRLDRHDHLRPLLQRVFIKIDECGLPS